MKRVVLAALALGLALAGGLWAWRPQRPQDGLVLYAAIGYAKPVAEAFTAQTGIPITVVAMSTGEILAKVAAEGRHPRWSLVWFDGDMAADAFDAAGLLAKGTAPRMAWTPLGRSLLPADGSYAPTGVTLAGVFTVRFYDEAVWPRRWADLAAPGLKNAVGMNNPSISGPTFPLVAGLLEQGGGWPAGQNFLLALKRNGLHIYKKNADTLAALWAGDIRVALTQSSAAWNLALKDPSFRVMVPDPAFVLPSVIAAAAPLTGTAESRARQFIAFTFLPQIQRLRMVKGDADRLYWPVTTDAPPANPALPDLATISLRHLAPERWGALEPEVNRWFAKAVTE